MKFINIFILLSVVLSLTVGCVSREEREKIASMTASYEDNNSNIAIENITDTKMNDFFREWYGMNNLESHRVLWTGNGLQVEFYFEKNVTDSEIDAARSFAIKKFVMGIMNQNVISAYEYWMMQDGKIRDISEVRCRIFIDEELTLQDNYKDMRLIGVYEK